MEIASLVLEAVSCLSGCIEIQREYNFSIFHLEKNIRLLIRNAEKLRKLRNDVKSRVQSAERQQMRRREQVDGWLRRVEEVEAQLDMILQEGKVETQPRCFCKSLRSRYNLSKKVSELLEVISELKTEGSFDDVADRLPPPLVDEMPLDGTVGMDSNFRQVWGYLCDRQVGIIGIYGMGGVGKTTLLTKINNELIGRVGRDYDVVTWVLVSRDLNMERVQDKIGQKLGFPDDLCRMSQGEKTNSIYRVLLTKRFVLLLDDVWEHFDLTRAGIPIPNEENKDKIVLTTRQEDVCDVMYVQKKFKVNCSVWREAWELFQSKVGEEVLQLNPAIAQLAKVIAEECSVCHLHSSL